MPLSLDGWFDCLDARAPRPRRAKLHDDDLNSIIIDGTAWFGVDPPAPRHKRPMPPDMVYPVMDLSDEESQAHWHVPNQPIYHRRQPRPAPESMSGFLLGEDLAELRYSFILDIGAYRPRPPRGTDDETPGSIWTDELDTLRPAIGWLNPEARPSRPTRRPRKQNDHPRELVDDLEDFAIGWCAPSSDRPMVHRRRGPEPIQEPIYEHLFEQFAFAWMAPSSDRPLPRRRQVQDPDPETLYEYVFDQFLFTWDGQNSDRTMRAPRRHGPEPVGETLYDYAFEQFAFAWDAQDDRRYRNLACRVQHDADRPAPMAELDVDLMICWDIQPGRQVRQRGPRQSEAGIAFSESVFYDVMLVFSDQPPAPRRAVRRELWQGHQQQNLDGTHTFYGTLDLAASDADAAAVIAAAVIVAAAATTTALQLDLSTDYLVWDNTETIAYSSVDGTTAAVMSWVLRIELTAREMAVSGGVYAGSDLNWLIPSAVISSGVTIRMGDTLTDSGGNVYTVLDFADQVRDQTKAQVRRLHTRNLAIVYELRDTIDIQRATITYDASGAELKTWPENGGGLVLYRGILARVQLLTKDIVEERGLIGFKGTHSIYVSRQVPLVTMEDRIKWVRGGITYYLDIVDLRNPERIDELPQIGAMLPP